MHWGTMLPGSRIFLKKNKGGPAGGELARQT
jgi:hypothetical protein